MPGKFNLPFLIAAIVSLHLTMFAVAVQMDILVFDSLTAKVASWALAALSWGAVYKSLSRPGARQPPVTIRRTSR